MVTSEKTTELMLTCPECGAECGMILNTSDLTTVECSECAATVDPTEAVDTLRAASEKWARFAAWLAGAGSV
jgi:hypothetical protein